MIRVIFYRNVHFSDDEATCTTGAGSPLCVDSVDRYLKFERNLDCSWSGSCEGRLCLFLSFRFKMFQEEIIFI